MARRKKKIKLIIQIITILIFAIGVTFGAKKLQTMQTNNIPDIQTAKTIEIDANKLEVFFWDQRTSIMIQRLGTLFVIKHLISTAI